MSGFTKCCLVFVAILQSLNCFAQLPFSIPEKDALPSEVESLKKHIAKNLVFPEDARSHGRYGIVYVQFEVDERGYFKKNSVKTLSGLSSSCDKEAERVIKSYNEKWTVNPRDVNRKPFIIPVSFAFNGNNAPELPSHILQIPLRTIVQAKNIVVPGNVSPANTYDSSWSIYSLKGFEMRTGRISPGDSVVVVGWAARSYFIQTKDLAGYVSQNALHINADMEDVAKTVRERSDEEDRLEEQAKMEKKAKTPPVVARPLSETSFLSLTASKTSVFLGECTTITFAFNVRRDNEWRIQFYDLGPQLYDILTSKLNVEHAFIVDNHIVNIEGVETKLNNHVYTTYKIYEAAYCPNREQPVIIQPIKLNMIAGINAPDEITEFVTKPVTVNVKRLPVPDIKAYSRYRMVGDFKIDDEIEQGTIMAGKPFSYRVKIQGEGLTFPIEPLNGSISDLDVRMVDMIDNDTIVNGRLYSDRTFIYRIVPMREGSYNLGQLFNFSYFNPHLAKVQTIKSSKVVVVKGSSDDKPPILRDPLLNQYLIAIDASTSMMIEDYEPHRLQYVINGLKEFFRARQDCDIQIMTFAGDIRHLRPCEENSCYSPGCLDSITFHSKRGTAIGDAIWRSCISMDKGAGSKKVVIIGDGDNTAGTLNPMYAADLAKTKGIQVFTIGIGHQGLVPFGRDISGNANMIDNTFTDVTLKKISQLTGGQYYYATDANHVARILTEIFSK